MIALLSLLTVVSLCQGDELTLRPGVTVLVDGREPLPLRKAAEDLVEDLEAVLGTGSAIVDRAGEAGALTICVALEHNLPPALARPEGWEVSLMQAVAKPWAGAPVEHAVVLTGSDVRGAIYAVYGFAERHLGVDPLHWWTDHPPARRDSVALAASLRESDGPPTFRYRGWFTNDEDLLTFWRPGYTDNTGIALEVWDRLYEALLRQRGNMVVPGTFIFPDEPQVYAAADRGLVISQHHVDVLNTNTYRWPDDVPYSITENAAALEAAWENAVRQHPPGAEVLWTLGYRGTHDRPFWRNDPNAPATAEGRAAIIRGAIDKQIEIVKRHDPEPVLLTNSWGEGSSFIRDGLLEIPEDVFLVWADRGHGLIQDDGRIGAGDGVYYHTAMMNFRANQLTEMVPLDRIRRELGRAVRAGATSYMLVNNSDVRPFVLTTSAVMDLAWNAAPWLEGGAEQDAAFVRAWCERQFGARAAPILAEYYAAYFAAPARYGEREDQVLSDNYYHTLARDILVRLIEKVETPPTRWIRLAEDLGTHATRLAELCEEAAPRWQRAAALAARARPLVPEHRRGFFQTHVLTQLAVHEHSNRMLQHVAAVVHAAGRDEKLAQLADAAREIDAVRAALRAAEYGKWQNFFANEMFTDVEHTQELVHAYACVLRGEPVPPYVVVRTIRRDPYDLLTAYQGKRTCR